MPRATEEVSVQFATQRVDAEIDMMLPEGALTGALSGALLGFVGGFHPETWSVGGFYRQGPELELYQAILRIDSMEGVITKVKSIPHEKRDALQAA